MYIIYVIFFFLELESLVCKPFLWHAYDQRGTIVGAAGASRRVLGDSKRRAMPLCSFLKKP